MEIFFTDKNFKIAGHPFKGVPFFVDSDYKLLDELNEFFTKDLLVDGRIASPITWKSYAYWLNDFMQWARANGINWKASRKEEIVAYRNWSLEECKLKPSTINSRITVLKRFFKYALRAKIVSSNPIAEVESQLFVSPDSDFLSHTQSHRYKRNDLSVKVTHELPKIYSDVDLLQLFNAVKSDRLRLMMRLMLECGLRRSEVASLPEKLILDVTRVAQQFGPGSEIPFPLPAYICKGKKARTVILSYQTAMRLMQYRATVRPKLVRRFKAVNNAEPEAFWLTQMGTAYRPESLTTEVNNLAKAAGIENANPHKFRHTFATNLYAITGDLRLVQKLLGHSHIQTSTVYEHTAAIDRTGAFADYQKYIDSMIGQEGF